MRSDLEETAMAETTTGWRRVFSIPTVYRWAQRGIGSPNVRRTLVEVYLRPSDGDRLLDIGCGTGDLVAHLSSVQYVGHDPSADYVAAAEQRFGEAGTFLVGGVGEVTLEPGSFDLAVAKGVLHHLDDDVASALFDEAAAALRPGGRLVTIDPAFDPGQSRVARFLASRDRGQNVRTIDGYRALVPPTFTSIESTLHDDLLRVPYNHAVLVATR
jgi:SAM-dependent methyltransferase